MSTRKIGITSGDYARWGERRYKKLKELGYSCLDYNIHNTDLPLYHCSEKELEAMMAKEKALAAEAGIEISQVHGPWRWPPKENTEDDRAERLEKMSTSIRATAMLGCKYWVIHPIMPFHVHDTKIGKEQETWDLNMAFMTKVLKVAKEYDVTVCLENMPMPEFSIASPADILRMVRAINDDHFKICLDAGHVAMFKVVTAGDAVRELGNEIRVLHIHDNRGSKDLHLMPWFGIIDWEDFGKALKEINFQGAFSFELGPPSKAPIPFVEDLYRTYVTIAECIMGEDD